MGKNIICLLDSCAPIIIPLQMPTVTKEYYELPTVTHNLIVRLVKENDSYFLLPDSDQIQMMLLHPVMVWNGLQSVIYLSCLNLFLSTCYVLS